MVEYYSYSYNFMVEYYSNSYKFMVEYYSYNIMVEYLAKFFL